MADPLPLDEPFDLPEEALQAPAQIQSMPFRGELPSLPPEVIGKPSWGEIFSRVPEQWSLGSYQLSRAIPLMSQMYNEPRLDQLEQTARDMSGMEPDDYIQANPGHWLAQEITSTRRKVVESKAHNQLLRQEIEKTMIPGGGVAADIIGSAAVSAPATAAGIATFGLAAPLGIAGLAPTLGAAVGIGAGSAATAIPEYQEAREAGLPSEKAAAFALQQGIIEGALEGIPFFAAARYGSSALKAAITFTAYEGGTEALQEGLQAINSKYTHRPEMSWGEVFYQAGIGGATGVLLGGLFGGGLGTSPRRLPQELREYKADAENIIEEFLSAKDLASLGQPVDLVAAKAKMDSALAALNDKTIDTIAELAKAAPPTSTEDERAAEILQKVAEKIDAPPNPETEARIGEGARRVFEAVERAAPKAPLEEEEVGAADVGRSPKAQANLVRYANKNDSASVMDLPILRGPVGSENLTLKQAELEPGTYTVGFPTAGRPEVYLQQTHDFVEAFRQRFLPGETIVVGNQSAPLRADLSYHAELGEGVHYIVPREAINIDQRDPGRYNPVTQMETYSSLTHELGHALLKEVQRRNIEFQQVLQDDWRALRDAIDSGRMTAGQFVDTWLGPGKVARGLIYGMEDVSRLMTDEGIKAAEKHGPERAKNRYKWLEDIGITPEQPARQAIEAFYQRFYRNSGMPYEAFYENFLNFDEYFAEQTARYEFHKGEFESGLAKFFQAALRMLRQFFRWAKAEGRIAPSDNFRNWLEDLGQAGGLSPIKGGGAAVRQQPAPRVATPDEITAAIEKATEVKREAAIAVGQPEELKPVEPEYAFTQKDLIKALLSLNLPRGSPARQAVMKALAAGKLQEAANLLNDLAARVIRYDTGGARELETFRPMPGTHYGKNASSGINRSYKATLPDGRQMALKVLPYRGAMAELAAQRFYELFGLETIQSKLWLDEKTNEPKGIASVWNNDLSVVWSADWHKDEWIRNYVASVLIGNPDIIGPPNRALGQGQQENLKRDTDTGNLVAVDTGFSLGFGPEGEEDVPLRDWVGNELKAYLDPKVRSMSSIGGSQFAQYTRLWASDIRDYIEWHMPSNLSGRLEEILDANGFEQEFIQDTKEKVANRLRALQRYYAVNPESHSAETAGLTEEEAKRPDVQDLAKKDWTTRGLRSRFAKRYFGDWEKTEKAPKAVSGTDEVLNVPVNSTVVADPVTNEPLKVFAPALPKSFFLESGRFHGLKDLAQFFYIATSTEAAAKSIEASRREMTPITANVAEEIEWIKTQAEALNLDLATGQAMFLRQEVIDKKLKELHELSVKLDTWQAHYAELVSQQTADVPINRVYLNIRNPLYIRMKEGRNFNEVLREGLASIGADNDGIIMFDARLPSGEVTTLYLAMQPWQVKLDTNVTFSRGADFNYDLSTPEGANAQRLTGKLRRTFKDNKISRAVSHTLDSLKYTFLQGQQLAHLHSESEGFGAVTTMIRQYTMSKQRLMSAGENLLSQWQTSWPTSMDRVIKAMRAEFEGGAHWTVLKQVPNPDPNKPAGWVHELGPQTMIELKKFGIDATDEAGKKEVALYLDTKNTFLRQLMEAQNVFAKRIIQRYASLGPAAIVKQAKEVGALVHRVKDYREKPFLPQQRFGSLIWQVEEKDAKGVWRPIHREAFESQTEWEDRGPQLKRTLKGSQRIVPIKLDDRTAVLMMLPSDYAEMAAAELGLTQDQTNILMALMQPVKQDRTFKSYEQRYLQLTGASNDFLRSMGAFFWHNSNALAKIEWRGNLNLALRALRGEVRAIQAQGLEGSQEYISRKGLLNFAERTIDHTMNPATEYYKLRTFVSLTFLWGNYKTAFLNLYGMVTTWSALQTRLGTLKGNVEFWKAALRDARIWNQRKLNPSEKAAMQRAMEEGVLEQSYAFYLASQATAGAVARRFSSTAVGKYAAKAKKYGISTGMWAFRASELAARRTTFLAEYRAAKAEGATDEVAYGKAVEATNLLQNDYSLGARPEFMRGRKSLAFVFMSFTQHMAFHAFGGYELGLRRQAIQAGRNPRSWFFGYTMKLWLTTLLLAGLEGLPGFENILDIMDLVWRKLFGRPVRLAIRETYRDVVGRDPAEVMYGLSRNIGGFDVSRSLGFGRMVPGTEALDLRGSVYEDAGKLALALAGPAGNFVRYSLATLYNDGQPWSSLERYTTGMPGGVGNILRATQWSINGVRARDGSLLTIDRERDMVRDLTALERAGAAAGFQPAIVTRERERRFEMQDEIQYWQHRRSILLSQYWNAEVNKDSEFRQDVVQQIKDFNAEVPHPQMRITADVRRRSLDARRRQQRASERGVPIQKSYRGLAREVGEAY